MESRFLGDYHVIKQIGQGSLGTVLLAEHRFMKKPYVLKVLPEELASDRSFVQRFEEEVGLLSSLEHPNIVKVHNVSFAQGQYFLVTDCIVDELGETTNLCQYILSKGSLLDENEITRFLKQIAEGLDYAHSKKFGNKGVVHRGLKLNNILIGKGKNHPEAYISDFGLSRVVGMGAVLTRTYKIVAESVGIAPNLIGGKPGLERYPNPPLENQKISPLHSSFLQNYAFLAPEQKRLDHPHPIDAKTDVYSFGILAYFLLTGEFPEGLFTMPSKCSQFEGNWDHLIQNCLQNDPSRRPESLLPLLQEVFTRSEQPKTAYRPSDGNERIILRPVIHDPQLEIPTLDPDPAAVFKVESSVKQYKPEPKEVKNVQPLLTEMVIIPGGEFWRGSNDGNRDEMPRHQVTLASFAIDLHPVTNEQFVRFLEALGGEKDSSHNDIIRLRESRIKRSGGKLSIESGYAKHPVVGVTWYGAVAYARWIGKRLPTEAEWEVATRGGHDNSLYPYGEDIEKTQANFFSSDTTAVMSYIPNGYGLYDIVGNVYEWCQDWYGYNYYEVSLQEPENPQGPIQGVYRVLRGGCWKSLKEDLRCSRRHRNNPGTVNSTYGFRCAADVE